MALINAGRNLQEPFTDAGSHSRPDDHPETHDQNRVLPAGAVALVGRAS